MSRIPALHPPDPRLCVCVVVPARDEEARIEACIAALAGQVEIARSEWELLLVIDPCRDRTHHLARAALRRHPALRGRILAGPGRGSGGARGLGMDVACDRLHAVGRGVEGLIATTDADSTVAPNWLTAQLRHVADGARAIGGRIVMCDSERATLSTQVIDAHAAHSRERFRRVRNQLPSTGGRAEHWQFSGASLAVTAATYAEVGGLGAHLHSEDEALERALITHGIAIERHLSVQVTTSARTDGRSARGLAHRLRELAEGA